MAFGHGFAFDSPTEVAAKPAPMYDHGERRAPHEVEADEEAVVVANCAVPSSARAYYWELTLSASRPGADDAPLDLLVGLFPEALVPTPGGASELSFMYRYILRESCSQFDSLPLTSLTIPQAERATARRVAPRLGARAQGRRASCAGRGRSS